MSDDEDDADEARRQMTQNSSRQASSKFGRGNALASTKEVELHGVLEKRNRNGIFQKRYFQTERSLLKYWSSENDTNNLPSTTYDVRDVRLIHSVAVDQMIYVSIDPICYGHFDAVNLTIALMFADSILQRQIQIGSAGYF
jgi:hypothetical protein